MSTHLYSIRVVLVLGLTPEHDVFASSNKPFIVLNSNDIGCKSHNVLAKQGQLGVCNVDLLPSRLYLI